VIELEPVGADVTVLRAAYGTFPTGVTAICAVVDGVPDGFAASSFTAVSLDPPLVSVTVQGTARTWPRLVLRPRLGVTVLGDGHGAAARQLAGRAEDRFAGLRWVATASGAVLLHHGAAWMDCSVHASVPAGDHELIMLRVHGLRVHAGVTPLVFHASTFHRLTSA
jgi:flavin reductase (DIM6/NTAB) family NADH-FMN oxidoreductase RutF